MSQIHVSLDQLQRLQLQTQGLAFRAGHPIKRLPLGKHNSRLRGRGLNFEELRPYQHGDDIRTLDWKVTMRTQKPHIRVFSEERDRNVMLLLDQRLSMFFGSSGSTKSALAAEAAALSAWVAQQHGDRVGAQIFDDCQQWQLPPKRSLNSLNQLLATIVAVNQRLSARAAPAHSLSLTNQLQQAAAVMAKDSLLIIISDGHDWDDASSEQLKALLQHHQILLFQVQDPLELKLPSLTNMVLSNGELQLQLDRDDQPLRQHYQQHLQRQQQRFAQLAQHYPFARIPLLTTEPIARQLQPWFGGRL